MSYDPVNHPKHYTSHPSGVECITITEHMGFNLGNALKYIWRADLKHDAIEDLKKARWYLDRELAKRIAAPETPEPPAMDGDDGWIKWNGGDCPMSTAIAVQVKLRSGIRGEGLAGDLSWRHIESRAKADIVAYRIIKTD